jgi:dUTPase
MRLQWQKASSWNQAQSCRLVFQKVEHADFVEVEELPGSGRSDGGFGSTGLA